MNKEYKEDINGFQALEKALNDWFNVFKWNVNCSFEALSSIKSISQFCYSVKWNFNCSNNKLTTLEWCPESVWWNFDCAVNRLTSLNWCPQFVNYRFKCDYNSFKFSKTRYNIFKLWEYIYIWKPNNEDINILTNCDISNSEQAKIYRNSFKKFTQSTTKLNKTDITDTDITFKWKKFKRKILNV